MFQRLSVRKVKFSSTPSILPGLSIYTWWSDMRRGFALECFSLVHILYTMEDLAEYWGWKKT